MSNELILVAEDEAEIAEIISTYLERAGYRAITASDGDSALKLWRQLAPSLLLLDVKMPNRDGIDVLRCVRQSADTPVIMVTAMAEELERISALRLGADDYVVKPFSPLEVVERVKAVLRRTDRRGGRRNHTVTIRSLIIDHSAHAAFVARGSARDAIPLTHTEYAIVATMASRPTRAYSRSELIDACLPESEALERTIDSHISNARRKLDAAGISGFLETVRGVGYRLEPLQ